MARRYAVRTTPFLETLMAGAGAEDPLVRQFRPDVRELVTTPDEVPDPANLDMKLWVGDELRQSANTRDLVLDIPGMIETASAVMTLYPGDIIATGTPEGVGPVVDGDVIRIVIDQVGEMNVPVVQGNRGMTEVFAQPYVPPIIKQN